MESDIEVEFIYDSSCSQSCPTRENLEKALSFLKINTSIKEWDSSLNDNPNYVNKLGAPTIIINGEDVQGRGIACDDLRCTRFSNRAPSVEQIVYKIREVID